MPELAIPRLQWWMRLLGYLRQCTHSSKGSFPDSRCPMAWRSWCSEIRTSRETLSFDQALMTDRLAALPHQESRFQLLPTSKSRMSTKRCLARGVRWSEAIHCPGHSRRTSEQPALKFSMRLQTRTPSMHESLEWIARSMRRVVTTSRWPSTDWPARSLGNLEVF